jgi:protein-tyrosine phosphatase
MMIDAWVVRGRRSTDVHDDHDVPAPRPPAARDGATPRVRVLMVCLGNICRSTMAEATLRHLAVEAGLAHAIEVDSAGTGDWHVGSPPHPQTQEQLVANGIDVGPGRARQVTEDDLEAFDHVVAMDTQNLADLRRLAARAGGGDADAVHARITLLLDDAGAAAGGERDVPDPYLVGGYDRVFELVHAGCRGLLDRLARDEGLAAD